MDSDSLSSPTDRPTSVSTARWVAVAALVTLVFALFWPAVGAGFLTWDDDPLVRYNPLVRDASVGALVESFVSIENCNYHPLTLASYRLEYALVGLEPWLYHLDNLLIHAGTCVLAFFLASAWLGRPRAAFAVALLFAVHPLRVESVAWVSERKDLLCGFFFLAALLAFPFHEVREPRRRRAMAFACFVLALLSKVMAVSLPVVILLGLWQKGRLDRNAFLRLVPWFVLSLAFSILGIVAQSGGEAVGGLHGGSIVSHALTLPKALAFYLQKLVFPLPLSAFYLLAPARGLLDPMALAGIAAAIAAAILALRSARRSTAVTFGLGFFAVTWLPVSGLVPSNTIVADRYMYLPAFGLFLSFADLVSRGLDEGSLRRRVPALAGVAATIGLLALSLVLTPARASAWKSDASLWEDALREDPANCVAQLNLSAAAFRDGRYPEAASRMLEARREGIEEPKYIHSLSLAYQAMREPTLEESAARDLIAKSPEFLPARLTLLRCALRRGDAAEARRLYLDIRARTSADPQGFLAEAEMAESEGRNEDALRLLLQFEATPDVALGIAVLLEKMGDRSKALAVAREAVVDPGIGVSPRAWERLEDLLSMVEAKGPEADALELRRVAAPVLRGRGSAWWSDSRD